MESPEKSLPHLITQIRINHAREAGQTFTCGKRPGLLAVSYAAGQRRGNQREMAAPATAECNGLFVVVKWTGDAKPWAVLPNMLDEGVCHLKRGRFSPTCFGTCVIPVRSIGPGRR